MGGRTSGSPGAHTGPAFELELRPSDHFPLLRPQAPSRQSTDTGSSIAVDLLSACLLLDIRSSK